MRTLAITGTLAVAAVLLRAASTGSERAPEPPPTRADAANPLPVALETPAAPSLESPDWRAALLRLPPRFGDIYDDSTLLLGWVDLEAALLADDAAVRLAILERYDREPDAPYKGLLAVLLSADPATHSRLIEDFQTTTGLDWDLFRGMALFGLVKKQSASPEAARSKANAEHWWTLVRFVRSESSELILERRAKEDPSIGRPLWSCGGGAWSRMQSALERRTGAASPRMRKLFLGAYERDWEWTWIHRVTEDSLEAAAQADAGFAEAVVERYLASGDRTDALRGLRLIEDVQLSPGSMARVEAAARMGLDDSELLDVALYRLGEQESPETDRILLNLYDGTEGRAGLREKIVERMCLRGGAAYRWVALSELNSVMAVMRAHAVHILADSGHVEDMHLVIGAACHDADPWVRYNAVSRIGRLEPWPQGAREAVEQAAQSDPDSRVRMLAEQFLCTEGVQVQAMSKFSWDDPGPGAE